MAGRFEGLSELEWRVFVDIMPPEPTTRGRGMPHTPFRKIMNTLLYVQLPAAAGMISLPARRRLRTGPAVAPPSRGLDASTPPTHVVGDRHPWVQARSIANG